MRGCQRSVRRGLATAALILILGAKARAGERLLVDLRRKRPEPATAESRLSPELAAAARTGAAFLGLARDGRAVLEFPDRFDPTKAAAAIGIPRDDFALVEGRFERIERLVLQVAGDALEKTEMAGLPVRMRHETGGFVVLERKGGFPATALEAVAGDPAVRYAEPEYRYRLYGDGVPNDPLRFQQWGNGQSGIRAYSAWKQVHAASLVVAVIDTGIDLEHPDLRANLWSRPGEIPDNGLDDDGNGYVDDVHGYDFVRDRGDPTDVHGHGTHCAGILGGVGDNKRGVAGVAWRVRILSTRVFDGAEQDAACGVARLVRAIDYAVDSGARILNLSWGGPYRCEVLRQSLARAGRKGVLVVAAAGNGGEDRIGDDNDAVPDYPSSYTLDCIVSVAATDRREGLTGFSNYGLRSVDLGAPGIGILSCARPGKYGKATGTSASAPFAAGAAALAWERFPALDAVRIKALLVNHVRGATLAGKCVSGGVLDISFLGTGSLIRAAGVVRHPVFAIGGETTGTVLEVADGMSYELDAGRDARLREAFEKFEGSRAVVVGKLIEKTGVERKRRRTIVVSRIETPAEPAGAEHEERENR